MSSEQKQYDIWSEGYISSDGHGKACFHGAYPGETFDDAVEAFKKNYSGQVDTREGYGLRNEEGIIPNIKIHSIWACRLFPTESEARKSFG